jgi:hypothetical protein
MPRFEFVQVVISPRYASVFCVCDSVVLSESSTHARQNRFLTIKNQAQLQGTGFLPRDFEPKPLYALLGAAYSKQTHFVDQFVASRATAPLPLDNTRKQCCTVTQQAKR